MKTILKVLIIICLATAAAIYSSGGPGHVVIFLNQYRVDVSLTSLCLFVLLLYVLVYYLVRFWVNMRRLPNNMKKWRERNALKEGRSYVNNAGINYIECKFGSAYKNAMRSYKKENNKENQFLALMLAYKSASYMRNYEKEQEVLMLLDQYTDKKWQMAKYMAAAENQYALQKYGLCLDNLNRVLQQDKKHIPAHRLMLKVYLRLNNFDKAYVVLTWLVNNDYLEKIQAESYKLRIYRGLFDNITEASELKQTYNKLDKRDKENSLINQHYLDALIRLREYSIAIDLVKNCTDLSFLGENMVSLAKKITDQDEATKLLQIYEGFLVNNKQNPKLLLAIGILSFTLQLWGNARSYIESSLLLKPTIDGYTYLACVADATDNRELSEHARQTLLANIFTL